MSKKHIIIITLSTLAVLVTVLVVRHFLFRARVNAAYEYLSKRSPPYSDMSGQVLSDTYIIYGSDKNEEKGTTRVAYYPCPTGYECSELLSPKLGFSADEVTFDHCEGGVGCMDVVKDLLKKSGIEDVEAYLQERRLPAQ